MNFELNQTDEGGSFSSPEFINGDAGEKSAAGSSAPEGSGGAQHYESRYDAYRFQSTPDPAYRYPGADGQGEHRDPGAGRYDGPVPGGPGNGGPDGKKIAVFISLAAAAALLIGIILSLSGLQKGVKPKDSGNSGQTEVQIGKQDQEDSITSPRSDATEGTASSVPSEEPDAQAAGEDEKGHTLEAASGGADEKNSAISEAAGEDLSVAEGVFFDSTQEDLTAAALDSEPEMSEEAALAGTASGETEQPLSDEEKSEQLLSVGEEAEQTFSDEAASSPESLGEAPESGGAETGRPDIMTVPQVIASALPCMVSITNVTVKQYHDWFGNLRQFEGVSAGSGIIVGKTDTAYLIATNYHVIASSDDITVTFLDDDETGVSASVEGTDKSNDLAVISVAISDIPEETLEKIDIIRINTENDLRVGEKVVAIGNALGYGQSASAGIISALNCVTTDSDGTQHVMIQTDASINPGNSGGALLNMRGELIGINEEKIVDMQVEGVGYAIPMSTAYPVLQKLGNRSVREKADSEESAYLGIRCITMPESYTASGYPSGAYVDDVIAGGAADRAGIMRGDIIISIDGMDIASSDDVLEELSYHRGGEEIEVVIARVSSSERPGWDSFPSTEVITMTVVPDARSDMAS